MKYFLLLLSIVSTLSFAQEKVGINNTNPVATLDVQVSQNNAPETSTTNEGILLPRLSKERVANMASPVESLFVYVNDFDYTTRQDALVDNRVQNIKSNGFYVYDGTTWQQLQIVIPPKDYILSADGTILTEWLNDSTVSIDMNDYPDMENVTIIGTDLLHNSQVEEFIIREGVTYIHDNALTDNPQMTVTLPSTIEHIGQSAFKNTNYDGAFNLPNLISLGTNSFENVTGITSIDLPLIETIPQSAFQNITSLETINLPLVTTIDASAFEGATSLTSLSLPEVKLISNHAFEGATSLTSILLPEVEYIEYDAFFDASSLSNVTLGPKLLHIGPEAFLGIAPNATITFQAIDAPDVVSSFIGYTFESTTILRVPNSSLSDYTSEFPDYTSQLVGY